MLISSLHITSTHRPSSSNISDRTFGCSGRNVRPLLSESRRTEPRRTSSCPIKAWRQESRLSLRVRNFGTVPGPVLSYRPAGAEEQPAERRSVAAEHAASACFTFSTNNSSSQTPGVVLLQSQRPCLNSN